VNSHKPGRTEQGCSDDCADLGTNVGTKRDQARTGTEERQSHPLLHDMIQRQAQGLSVMPSSLQHFMIPEAAIPLMSDPGGQ
jgi:hypothetical protein